MFEIRHLTSSVDRHVRR